jgi:hypothetical protein
MPKPGIGLAKEVAPMAKKKDKPIKHPAAKSPPKRARPAKAGIPFALRAGATRVEVENSGLEVWLYDDANAGKIRAEDLWRKLISDAPTDGVIAATAFIRTTR